MNIKNLALGFIGFIMRAAILAIAILVVFKMGQKAYDFGYRIFTEEAMSPEPGRDVAVTIVQGDSKMDVAEMFEEKGLIRDAKLFYVQKICSEYNGDIKPGIYTLNTSMTAEDMFAIIAGKKDDEEDASSEEDETTLEAAPLTENVNSTPLDEVTGDWEGSEGDTADSQEDSVESADSVEATEE